MRNRRQRFKVGSNRTAEVIGSESQLVDGVQRIHPTRRSVILGALGLGASWLGWELATSGATEGKLPVMMRRGLEWNQWLAERYGVMRMAELYPDGAIESLRVNGAMGLGTSQTHISIAKEGLDVRSVSIESLRTLVSQSMITRLCCVEGWSRVNKFEGFSFIDFVQTFVGGIEEFAYVEMSTPDGRYYVGLDRESALHPQTLLCTRMNGLPLSPDHGAPLRLAMPIKYGYKQIKNIGRINFTQKPGRDYWAERGYDWFAGL